MRRNSTPSPRGRRSSSTWPGRSASLATRWSLRACAKERTIAISAATARISDLIDRHHQEAERVGVRIVPFCGASSVPLDLAAMLIVRRLGRGTPTVRAVLRLSGGSFSNGTIASIGEAADSDDAEREADPFLLRPTGDRSPSVIEHDPYRVSHDPALDLWLAPSPMGVSDTRAARLSAALDGRDLVIQEHLSFPGRGEALATWLVLRAFRGLVKVRSFRPVLSKLFSAGHPPADPEKGRYELRLVGLGADGTTAEVKVSARGDPGHRVTALCACESALALATEADALPRRFGVLTPSIEMGDVLIDRLRAAGVQIG